MASQRVKTSHSPCRCSIRLDPVVYHDMLSGRYDFLSCFPAVVSDTNQESTAAYMTMLTSNIISRN